MATVVSRPPRCIFLLLLYSVFLMRLLTALAVDSVGNIANFLLLFSMTRDVDSVGINGYMGIFAVVLFFLMLMPLVLRKPCGLMGLLVAESLPVVPLFPRLLAMTQDVGSVRSNVFLGFFKLAPSVGAL